MRLDTVHFGAWLASLIVATTSISCGGPPSPADLRTWASAPATHNRLEKVVADPQQPLALRTEALVALMEQGHAYRIHDLLEPLAELDRQALAGALVEAVRPAIVQRTDDAGLAKDAALGAADFIPDDVRAGLQRDIAAWAMDGLTWELSSDAVRQHLEGHIDARQITQLGPAGLELGALLVAKGLATDEMLRYFAAHPAPESSSLLLRALTVAVPQFGVNPRYLDAVRRVDTPAGAALLFHFYRDTALNPEGRDACFTTAALMVPHFKDRPEPERAPIAAELRAIARDGSIEDRWLAAANLAVLQGTEYLAERLKLFPDDGLYAKDSTDTGRRFVDFCLDLDKYGTATQAVEALRGALQEGNRVQRALAALCAKALAAHELEPDLRALVDDRKRDASLQDLLGEGRDGDGKSRPLSVATLAQNALDSLAYLQAMAAETPAPPTTELEARRFIASVEFETVGATYLGLVAERVTRWRAEQSSAPAP